MQAAARAAKNAFGGATLLRQSLQKENPSLFPMTDQVIPPAQQSRSEEKSNDQSATP